MLNLTLPAPNPSMSSSSKASKDSKTDRLPPRPFFGLLPTSVLSILDNEQTSTPPGECFPRRLPTEIPFFLNLGTHRSFQGALTALLSAPIFVKALIKLEKMIRHKKETSPATLPKLLSYPEVCTAMALIDIAAEWQQCRSTKLALDVCSLGFLAFLASSFAMPLDDRALQALSLLPGSHN